MPGNFNIKTLSWCFSHIIVRFYWLGKNGFKQKYICSSSINKILYFFFEVEAIIKGKKHTVSIYQSPLHLGLFSLSMEDICLFRYQKIPKL